MSLAYIVRCNFNKPDLERSWNDWYGGPKLKHMLAKPHFLSVQRFCRSHGQGRDYVAFWVLESEQALETPEYKNDWGFSEWQPYITDWSRDLFAPLSGDLFQPALGTDEALRLVSFEGLSESEAHAAKAADEVRRPTVRWLRSAGLDRHTPLIGYEVVDEGALCRPLAPGNATEGFYRPISAHVQAGRVGEQGRM